VGAKRGQKRKSAGRQRLGLILFAVFFVALFVIFAVAEGIGSPSVPSGDVAQIQQAPNGDVTEAEFNKALKQQATGQKLKQVPKPGEGKYDELKKAALEELFNGIWLRTEAEELGVVVTDKQVEAKLEEIKKENFPTADSFAKFLKESELSEDEVNERLELQLLGEGVEAKVKESAPEPTSDEIEAYFEAEKETKFTTKESRDVRVIINESKAKIDAAAAELEKDHSPAAWKKAATKYSSDPTSKSKGGLQPGVQEEFLPTALKEPIFSAATGELIGPIKSEKNYFLLEVVKLHGAEQKKLKEAEAEIKATLGQEKQQTYFSEFVAEYESTWHSRTLCADGFVIESCANFRGSGHPATAQASCYEANPKTPPTECPAPVVQTQPALPGTVTELKPKGEPFVQRPTPGVPAAAGKEGAATTPEGAPAPEGGAPPAEAAPEAEGSGEAGSSGK
jgi:parvulin-like peptidyl-prolyl isomerase